MGCAWIALAPVVRIEDPAASPEPAPLRLPGMPLHNPYILVYQPSKTYFLYTSNVLRISGTPGVGTMVYRSKDLRH